ncbi:MAG TPA: DNA polymerase III subunit delta [Gemmatimonadales bacterium]|nr:DNA polymerase III subunit delta [Gemmatimonadales bacterium]
MGPLTFDALLRSLKQGAVEPVYYLHGDESVLKDEAIRALLERVVERAARAFNVDQRNAADLDPESFYALVNTPPLLAAARLVVLRGLEQVRKGAKLRQELLRYLASPNPTTVLVLVQGVGEPPDPELAQGATAVAIDPLPPARVVRWMTHRAHQLGLTLTPEAGDLLLAAVGNDLATLARELEKLAAATTDPSRAATKDDVAALVGVRRGETLEDLVEAALARQAARAAHLVEPVLAQPGMSGVRIVTGLATALLGAALARAELARGTARVRLEGRLVAHLRTARPFGLGNWEAAAARWARWAELWRARDLSRALHQALAADRALKSSSVSDERGIVEQLVLSLAVVQQAAA